MSLLPGSSRSIASRILLLFTVLLVLIVGGGMIVLWLDNQEFNDSTTRQRVAAIALTVAQSPTLPTILSDGESVQSQAAVLQPYAEKIQHQTGADFVVIMRPDGIRLSHPVASNIGGVYIGSRFQALAGQTYIEVVSGTLGPSTRAITPIRNAQGEIVGLVSVGVTQVHITAALRARLWLLGGLALGALVVGGVGAVLIARWVGRQTLGMGPRELAQMHHYYNAALDSVHEGMVLIDAKGLIVTINPQGQRLLGVGEAAVGVTAAVGGLPSNVATVVDGAESVTDLVAVTDDRVLVITKRPVELDGRNFGSVVTLRDHTELTVLAGELDRVRGFSDALRSQAHESANRLHTVVSLIELGEHREALSFAVDELRVAQTLTDQVVAGVGDRAVAALLLGKSAQGAERGVELQIAEGFDLPRGIAETRELVTIIGNLIDNAFDAAAGGAGPRRVVVGTQREGGNVVITVADSGPGMSEQVAAKVFTRGFSTKTTTGPAGGRGLGLALVRQAVGRCGGIVVAEPSVGGRMKVVLPFPVAAEQPLPIS